MNRFLPRALMVTSFALFALMAARLVARDPRFIVVVAGILAVLVVPALLARLRMRKLLRSGDIARILKSWQSSRRGAAREEEAEEGSSNLLAPLVSATAYAAYGFIDAARASLARAERGPAWEVALEQRLFVEALLDVYEGERSLAVMKAAQLERLPLPNVGFWMRRKVHLLRRGVGALARAFAHTSEAGDERLLRDVASSSPLVHWAMRYARAVFLVDAGRGDEARALIEGAPTWPAESAFRAFHEELATKLAA